MPVRFEVRQVWSDNLVAEFALFSDVIQRYRFVAMDTEFPAFIFRDKKHFFHQSLADRYHYININVNTLHLKQVGLTFFDKDGNLPDLGTRDEVGYLWEFNFRDFNHRRGIDSGVFADLMLSSGLLCNEGVTWVTFHGANDFAFLLKIITSSPLPETLEKFMYLVRFFFGAKFFDVERLMRYCNGLYGGLEQLARLLKVGRMVGQSHQAGSDSLLTCQTFLRMKDYFFKQGNEVDYAGVLSGLEV